MSLWRWYLWRGEGDGDIEQEEPELQGDLGSRKGISIWSKGSWEGLIMVEAGGEESRGGLVW